MIDINSVITLTNGYVTADKLNTSQYIFSANEEKKTWLSDIEYASIEGILVETKYHMIISSPSQLFIIEDKVKRCSDLKVGDMVRVYDGSDEIINITNLDQLVEMVKLNTTGTFIANGFTIK